MLFILYISSSRPAHLSCRQIQMPEQPLHPTAMALWWRQWLRQRWRRIQHHLLWYLQDSLMYLFVWIKNNIYLFIWAPAAPLQRISRIDNRWIDVQKHKLPFFIFIFLISFQLHRKGVGENTNSKIYFYYYYNNFVLFFFLNLYWVSKQLNTNTQAFLQNSKRIKKLYFFISVISFLCIF